MRLASVFRQFTDFFDGTIIGAEEKENATNVASFKNFVVEMINERRSELKDPNAPRKNDFLTLLLTDELFTNKDDMIIDECINFIVAATQTTSQLISNTLYYFTVNQDKLELARKEVNSILKLKQYKTLTEDQCKDIFS